MCTTTTLGMCTELAELIATYRDTKTTSHPPLYVLGLICINFIYLH